jgi:hypothetical protein
MTINWSTPVNMSRITTDVTYEYTPDFTPNPNAVSSNAVDAVAFRRVPGLATAHQAYYSVRDGGQSILYRGNATTGDASGGRIGPIAGAGQVNGLAFVGDQMYGVDTSGNFFRFGVGAEGVPTASVTMLSTVPGAAFAGLTTGPQNLQQGAFANKLFAITTDGTLYCFNTNGVLQQVFDADGNGTADATSITTGSAQDVLGLAFSPLDINLWHPTVRRGRDDGHGINRALDETRNELGNDHFEIWYQRETEDRTFDLEEGGASMYFGLEEYVRPTASTSTPYLNYQSSDGQFGVLDAGGGADEARARWQQDLTSAADIGNNYNLPGGAYGSLITNSFSLGGSSYTDKPVLYFNYLLQTENAGSAFDRDDMRDSARVFISANGGAWQVVATNNSVRSEYRTSNGELPNFVSASSALTTANNQQVQELYDTATWRQARIDLGKWAGQTNLRLRFDFSTAGEFDGSQRDAAGNQINSINGFANTTGNFQGDEQRSRERGANNDHEGFYVDDVIIGYAERGEMVTGAAVNQTSFFDIATPAAAANYLAEQSLAGPYQLEIRRGTEYGVQPRRSDPDVAIVRQFGTNDDLVLANGQLGDANQPREQGQFLIESNLISNASTYGIRIDAAAREAGTNNAVPGTLRNLPTLSGSRLVPGVVVTNNVIANSGTGGILFSGDDGTGSNLPATAVPYGRIVNNTIYGGVNYAPNVTLAATTVSGQPAVTVPATSGLRVGMGVTGTGIPAGTRVLSIDNATSVTLSQAATVSGAAVNLAFGFATFGVSVTENAGPTLLNNLIANVGTGVSVDATSRLDDAGNQRTVIGTSAYYNVGTQITAGVSQSQQVVLGSDPFVNAATGNFYLTAGSRAIDSSLNTLGDRPEYVAVASAVGIPESPIIAPAIDLYGQLRADDPNQASLPGLGTNVFKDRGAIDRVDVLQPYLSILTPQDGAATDADPAADSVQLVKENARGVTKFVLQMGDNGVGIDKATVTSAAFTLKRNGTTLVEGADYLFRYFENNNQVVFESAAFFPLGAYVLTATTRPNVAGGAVGRLTDLANNTLLANQADGTAVFTITLADVPGVPTAVVGTPGEGQVSLAWAAPAASGSSAVIDYVVQYSSNGGVSWTTFADGTSTSTSAVVTPLANGTSYLFRVAAVNSAGQGDWSAVSAAVTPQVLPPAAPAGVAGTPGDSSVSLAWTASSPGTSPITDYEIEFSTNGGGSWTAFSDGTSTATTATVSPLANGTAHVFRVRAVNKNGASPWSALSAAVIPLALASAPTAQAVAGDSQATVTWTTPADNGAPISGYVIQSSSNGGSTWSSTNVGVVNSAPVTGLVNGTAYVFRVAAVTTAGTGNFSAPTAPITPVGLPGTPTGFTVAAGDRSASLSWTAPAANGGQPISDYVVQYKEATSSTWLTLAHAASTATNATVSGLTNGVSYVFRVAAVTSVGQGGFTIQSAVVTPLALAGAPTRLTGRAADGTVSLVWTAPRATGGQRIIDYVIDYSSDGGATWTRAADAVSAATRATVAVPNGVTYVFRVAAVTAGGVGAFSLNSGPLTPFSRAARPAAPTAVVGVGAGGTVALSWVGPPANAGGRVSDYVIQYRLSTSSRWVTARDGVSSNTSAIVSRLVAGRGYVFRVAAKNLAGQGAFSAETPEVIA